LKRRHFRGYREKLFSAATFSARKRRKGTLGVMSSPSWDSATSPFLTIRSNLTLLQAVKGAPCVRKASGDSVKGYPERLCRVHGFQDLTKDHEFERIVALVLRGFRGKVFFGQAGPVFDGDPTT
jgi:hypothetical protein